MSIAPVRIITLTSAIMRIIFFENLIQVEYSTLAIARPPMIAPHVGVKRLTRPLPATKIITITSGLKPNSDASGAIIGIDTVASPDEEGIRKVSTR